MIFQMHLNAWNLFPVAPRLFLPGYDSMSTLVPLQMVSLEVVRGLVEVIEMISNGHTRRKCSCQR